MKKILFLIGLLLIQIPFASAQNINPDAGEYEIAVTLSSVYVYRDHKCRGGSMYDISLLLSPANIPLFNRDMDEVEEHSNLQNLGTATEYCPAERPQRAKGIRFQAFHNVRGSSSADRSADNQLVFDDSFFPCSDQTFADGENKYPRLMNPTYYATVNVKIRPKEVNLFLQNTELIAPGQTDSYFLPGNKIIRIKATTGFPREVYQWRFKKGNDDWKSFDNQSISSDGGELSFQAEDFLTEREMFDKIPFVVDINNEGCAHSSQAIHFMPRPSAPKFFKTEEIRHQSCPESDDGSYTFSFSRDLLEEENIEVSFVLGNNPDSIKEIDYEIIRPNKCRIADLKPGTYSYRITATYKDQHADMVYMDADGEGYTFDVTIEKAIPVVFDVLEEKHLTCVNGNDGEIKVQVTGGIPPFRIICEDEDENRLESEWSESEVLTIKNLKAGDYFLWIEDSKGCSTEKSSEYVVLDGPETSVTIDRREAFRPVGDSEDGMIEVEVVDGQAPYAAVWRTGGADGALLPSDKIRSAGVGSSISILEGVPAGMYYVEFMDAQGCTTSEIIELIALPPFDIELTQTQDIACYGESAGELTVEVNSGGMPPYTYEWYHFEDPYRHQVGDGTTLSGIPAGWYQVKITDSAGNEVWTNLKEQTQEVPVNVAFHPVGVKCHGGNDGALEAVLSGGVEPYTYRWLTGNDSHTGLTLTGLTAGSYELEITDGNGCMRTVTGTVAEPDALTIQEQLIHPSCSGLTNGSIRLDIYGETAPYTISWESGEENNPYLYGLGEGVYTISVSDLNGCVRLERNYTLVAPSAIQLAVDRIGPVSEFGKTDGSASYFIEGGTPPYQIICRNANGQPTMTKTVQNPSTDRVGVDFTSLPEGHYTLSVRDSKFNAAYPGSCVAVDEFDITQPPPLSVAIAESHYITCNKGRDGQLKALSEGGVPGYTYNWYKVSGNDKIRIQGGDSILNGLEQGVYLVQVIDKNGVSSFSAPYSLSHLSPITIRLTAATLQCNNDNNGWVRAEVAGGTGVYQYRWNTGATTSLIEHVTGGTYSLTVTDGRGCSRTDSAEVTSPENLQINYEVFSPTCAGHGDGAINIEIKGGTQPYTFDWSTGHTGQFLENVYPGDYEVSVTDAKACGQSFSFRVPEIPPIKVNLKELVSPKAFQYSDGKLSVGIEGGTPPYHLIWTNEQGTVLGNDTTLENLREGTYFLRVEDANYPLIEEELAPDDTCGCLHALSFYVPEPPLLEVEIENTQPIRCFETNDGQLVAHAKGGVPLSGSLPYTYHWLKNGVELSVNDSIISDLGSGEYDLKIVDSNGIEVHAQTFNLEQPDLLQLTLSAADLRCSRDTNGWTEVRATGGTAPYVYNWSTGDSSPRVEQIPRGKYFVLVSDSRNCEVTGNTEIIQPGGIKAEVVMSEPACYQGSDGTIQVSITGGEAPYRYEWDNGDQSLSHGGLSAGQHSITITDVNECSHEVFTYELGQPDSIVIDLGPDWELCKDQTLELNAVISEPAESYTWLDPLGKIITPTSSVTLRDPGTYRAEVLTTKGCRGAGSITITRDERTIAADFVVASQLPLGEEIVAINISNPEPEEIEWILPGETGSFEMINSDMQSLELIFHQYGEYKIGMKTFSGKCEKTVYKTVKVMNKEDIADYQDADEPMLKQFVVSPNPNKGAFMLTLELKEASPVILQLVNSGTGQIVEKRHLQGAKVYTEHFYVHNAGKGTYVLNLLSPKAKAVQKVIVH